MVTVSNIEDRHISDSSHEPIAVRAFCSPQRMAHSIGRRKIEQRVSTDDVCRNPIDL
jgi:hypothetical protein